jgi:caa(3)-type oxidase subunit IV
MEGSAHADHGRAQYYWVWVALIVLTVVEIFLAYKHIFTAGVMLSVLLILSFVKAGLIIGYFMHLKFDSRRMQVVLMGSLIVCLALMAAFFPDAMRLWNYLELRGR